MKIVIPGGAGLVGQNLIIQLRRNGCGPIVVLDKHLANLEIVRRMHPDVVTAYADLAETGWEKHFDSADAVVMLQAQIGGEDLALFTRNNLTSTTNVLSAIKRYKVPYIVHVSSSVVVSVAEDHYTDTKMLQEKLVADSGIDYVTLRPTLMFGWFDRKHLGWLSRFMRKSPVFPIPGNGRFMRQPLYVGDCCAIIAACLEKHVTHQTFNITGLEKIDYIDIIRQIRRSTHSRTALVKIPYRLFYLLLKLWAMFDINPPFTASQLKALAGHDEFEVIDWPGIFGVEPTPFDKAITDTFTDPHYSKIVLEF